MSILDLNLDLDRLGNVTNGEQADYVPDEKAKVITADVLTKFALGYTTMYAPRVEFNDLSTIGRQQVDTMAFNTYQPNNGDSNPGDAVNGWRSNAIRPVERNKVISIAAHAAARPIYPKIFATDEGAEPQEDAAHVLKDLMEWSGEKYGYDWTLLTGIIQALVEPAAIVHTEFTNTYRDVKRPNDSGEGFTVETVLDEDLSGFRDTIIPTEQLYIENFFEPDVQKQGWLIWRRVQDHRLMETKYGHLPNFKYVRPSMQIMFNDANQGFYYVYDPNMRQYLDEEVIYYEKHRDLQLTFVNGVLLTDPEHPNPRVDKLYPFAKFGYEFIRSAQCFYYKSLVFKVSHDANIINTIYPMMIDGTYLNLMPPFLNQGGEIITSDVIVPGRVTTFSDASANLQPLKVATDLKSGIDALMQVEESVNQSSEVPVAAENTGNETAYEVSKREQERNQLLGLFLQMIGSFVKQYGRLRLGDILQHLTVADATKITQEPGLVYKTFLVPAKNAGDKKKYRKIKFDERLFDPSNALEESYRTLTEQGGLGSEVELYRVNPQAIRDLTYNVIVSPDVLAPRSEDVERMYKLEAYDRAIQNPVIDLEQATKDFLLSSYNVSARDPDKYLKKQEAPQGTQGIPSVPGAPTLGPQPNPNQPQVTR